MIGVNRRRMPLIDGATEWLNSEPLGPSELRGHVVLVDFWTFTCINWLRTEPYIRAWAKAYRDDGLVVIGVHTPEFSFEHDVDRVRQAIDDRRIDYPVVIDNDYGVWNSFDNNYWPALYFVDPDGVIRDHHFGEGSYEKSERIVQRLLDVKRELGARRCGRHRGRSGLESPACRRRRTSATGAVSGSCRPRVPSSTSPERTKRLSDSRSTTGPWSGTGPWGANGFCSIEAADASPFGSTLATPTS